MVLTIGSFSGFWSFHGITSASFMALAQLRLQHFGSVDLSSDLGEFGSSGLILICGTSDLRKFRSSGLLLIFRNLYLRNFWSSWIQDIFWNSDLRDFFWSSEILIFGTSDLWKFWSSGLLLIFGNLDLHWFGRVVLSRGAWLIWKVQYSQAFSPRPCTDVPPDEGPDCREPSESSASQFIGTPVWLFLCLPVHMNLINFNPPSVSWNPSAVYSLAGIPIRP